MADVCNVQRKLRSLVNQNGACCLNQMAMVAPAFTHDQTLRGAHAARGPVERNRLIQHKVCAHFKSLLDACLAAYHSKSDAAFVGFALPQLAKDQRAVRHLVAIDQNSVIFAAQQDVAGLVSIVGKIEVNIGRVEDPAYRTMYFRVPAEEERLESHTRKGYLNRHIPPSNQRNGPAIYRVTALRI